MASKTVNIDFKPMMDWLSNFFKTMTTYETIAVVGIGVGLIMFIVGLILL